MSISSPVRKAIYLSPSRLELLHRRHNLSGGAAACKVCAVESCRMSWPEFADWLRREGFRVEKVRPLYITLAAPGMPYTCFGWMKSCAESDRLLALLEAEHPSQPAPLGGQGVKVQEHLRYRLLAFGFISASCFTCSINRSATPSSSPCAPSSFVSIT